MSQQEEHPIVFISYSHDDDNHSAWVESLACYLRQHGVDVIFDKWDLSLGKDLRFFMENGLSKCRKVICVCSETYVAKFNAGVGGVGYESNIITQDLLRNVTGEYILPIVRNNYTKNPVPIALGTKFYVDFSDESKFWGNYRLLLEAIYGRTRDKIPQLGVNPFTTSLAEQISIQTKIDSLKYVSYSMFGKITFYFSDNDGIFTLGAGEYSFKTKWSRAGNDSIHAIGNIGYKAGETQFPYYPQIADFNFSSHSRTIRTDEIVIFQNECGNFMAIKMGKVESSNHGYPIDKMVFEYMIYDSDVKVQHRI